MMTLLAPLSALVVGCSAPTTDDRRDDEAVKAAELAAATEQPFVRATADGYYTPDNPPQQPPVPGTIHDYTEQGALDFAQYWIDTLNHMWYTGNAAELRRISREGCESCQRFISSTETVYGRGDHIEGGGTTVSRTGVTYLDAGSAIVTGSWENGVDRLIGPSGEPIESGAAVRNAFGMKVSFDSSTGWAMDALSLAERGRP